MIKPRSYISVLFLSLLVGCDCMQKVSGRVLDSDTNLPIDHAQVSKLNYNDHEELTDSVGNFTIRAISGGLCGCPPMIILIKKNGYIQRIEKIKNRSHKVISIQKNLK